MSSLTRESMASTVQPKPDWSAKMILIHALSSIFLVIEPISRLVEGPFDYEKKLKLNNINSFKNIS